ncbi:SDR family NAD(P)-dependent oxidoreductase [Reyranella sp.]|uniref:SDR family NAD(P)-dependent oxidoreductase n=1 Tax=Reyranella sp. TaxID=1929291 RepID=UPI003D099AC9
MGRLTGRIALVTGSGRGIGRAIALAYAREGAHVGLTSRTGAQLDQVAAEILAAGGEAFAVAADLMNGAAIKSMVSAMIGHFGRLDILVNNGGGIIGGGAALHALTHDDELFEKNLFLNLTSAYYATRAALPQMVKQDYGRVIFIGSGHAKRGGGPISYTAAKHALVGLTRALAYQVPPTITVNTLSPGWINTSLVDFARIGAQSGIDASAARAIAMSASIQKRILEPEELAPMAVLLASEEGGGITGQEVSVDGGYRV